MKQILMVTVLTILQFAAGFGLLSILKVTFRPGIFLPLALISGVAVFSLIPFLLQLLYIPITAVSVFTSILFFSFLLNANGLRIMKKFKPAWAQWKFKVQLYELPTLLLICFMVFVSVWRCFYYPPYPRDLTSGAEVIAEYTTREKTMINSVFSVNLETTNNQFKPPYITSLQVIYKYAGIPFGQLWLSTLFISFLVFLYHVLIIHIHRWLAGLLLVFFIAIPEMYAFTFMALYDYSNAIYFALGAWFLSCYLSNERLNDIVLSGLMMGFATYARSETLILSCMVLPVIIWHHIRKWNGSAIIIKSGLFFLLPAMVLYILPVMIYINYYLPQPYSLQVLINKNIWNPVPFFDRFTEMNTQLIFSETGINYYGYFIFIFLIVLLLDLVLTDKWDYCQRNVLYTIAIVYLGLPFIGYLLPLYDLDHSTKRGLFKIFPLMLLYMGCSGILRNLSDTIRKWEMKQQTGYL